MTTASAPRVLQVVWNLIRGGTEGQCARVSLGLAAQGIECRVAVSRHEGLFLDAVERALGPVHVMDIHRTFSPHTLAEVLRLVRFIHKERIDLLHAWDADAAIFGSWAARLAGIPFLTSRRDLGEIYGARKLRRMERADLRAAAVVVNASAIGDRLLANGVSTERVCLMPNILDVDEFDQLAARPLSRALPPGRWIGMVARLDPEKDAATLLRAAARVAVEVADARFVLAGDGVERAQLERLAHDLNLGERVVFLGDVKEVPALLSRLYAGVLCPQSNEGLSNSILEYQAAALPVVATDCGGNRELVGEGTHGYIVPVGDVEALARRLVELLRHPDQARSMGQAGRVQVETRHRPELVCARFANLYRRTLEPDT